MGHRPEERLRPPRSKEEHSMAATRQVRTVSMAAVTVSVLNTRKNLEAGTEDAGIAQLAESIRQVGLMNPPHLRALPDGSYEVVAGQRRVLACQLLNMMEIDAFIIDSNDAQAVGMSLVENLQRADMHPLDKARGLADLVKRTGSDRRAAESTGLSIQTVRKYLNVLELPEDLRVLLGTGEGPSGVGAMSALARTFTDPEDQRVAWEKLRGFKGADAEDLLRRSRGDMGSLDDLREQALTGTFDVERCGDSLATCPWLQELSSDARERVEAALGD
jgi:ParB/RepB/Spo0J family partition protein